jgi:hypothetical protein
MEDMEQWKPDKVLTNWKPSRELTQWKPHRLLTQWKPKKQRNNNVITVKKHR